MIAVIKNFYKLFDPFIVGFAHFLSSWKCLVLSSGVTYLTMVTGWFQAFKFAFIRDHNIAFEVTWPIILFVLFETIVWVVGSFLKKYSFSKAIQDFMVQIILYMVFIKIVDKLCFDVRFAFVGNSLLYAVMIHQTRRIIKASAVVFPGIFPKAISNFDWEQFKKTFKR